MSGAMSILIFFRFFLKYWPSSCDFNKLVIKAKMHVKIYFFEIFFVVRKYDVIFSLRDLAVCMKTKTFFFQSFDENRVL